MRQICTVLALCFLSCGCTEVDEGTPSNFSSDLEVTGDNPTSSSLENVDEGTEAATPSNSRSDLEEAKAVLAGNSLKNVVLEYMQFQAVNGHPPANPDDLLKNEPPDSVVREALESGDFIVTWSVNLELGAANPNLVLGYHKDAPQKGGPVGFINGSVRNLSKAEFEAAIAKAAEDTQ